MSTNYDGYELVSQQLRAIEKFIASLGSVGGLSYFSSLLDKDTVDIPSLNTPLKQALSAKADLQTTLNALASKQINLIAGTGITLQGPTISADRSFSGLTGDPSLNAALVALIDARINGQQPSFDWYTGTLLLDGGALQLNDDGVLVL